MSTTHDDSIGRQSDVAGLVPPRTPDVVLAAPSASDGGAPARHRRLHEATLPGAHARRPLPVSVAVVASLAIGGMVWIGDLRSGARVDVTAVTASGDGASETATPRQPVVQRVPDFSAYGFRLDARQAGAQEPGQAVALFYVREDGHRLVFYRVASDQADVLRPALLRESSASLLSWSADGTTYALAGEVDGETLMKLGSIAAGTAREPLSASRATAAIEAQSATVTP